MAISWAWPKLKPMRGIKLKTRATLLGKLFHLLIVFISLAGLHTYFNEFLAFPFETASRKMQNLCIICVRVNTVFFSVPVTVASGDKALNEFDWPAGAKTAHKERLVAGIAGDEAATAWLEHKPGFAGQLGIATAQGA
jgi:hypothetical protein